MDLKGKYYQDRFCDVEGINLRYWDIGEGDPAVVFIHGFTGSVEEWGWTLPPLAGGQRLIALDLPGHGRSDKPDIAYTYDDFVRILHGFLTNLRILKPCIVGHSMGGGLSIKYAIDHPDNVGKLVLIAPVYGTKFAVLDRLVTLPFLGEYLLRPSPSLKHVRRKMRLHTLRPIEYADETVRRYYEFEHSPGYRAAALKCIRNYLNVFGVNGEGRKLLSSIDRELPAIRHPVFLIWGRDDGVIPFSSSEKLKKKLSNIRSWDVDSCGHCPNLEYPQEFNARINEFILN